MCRVNINIMIVVCLLIAAVARPLMARTIYVDPNGSADFNNIQAAIDDPCTINGDKIEVAPGTYYESINFNGKAVHLYSSDGPDSTTIDANGAYHVVECVSGEGANTILEGFTITGGNASGVGHPHYHGGGMVNIASSPTVSNCKFTGNSSQHWGGGMYNDDGSHSTVINCTFSENISETGGGGIGNWGSSPMVTNCTFSDNNAPEGGGMYCMSSSPTVTNCIFWGDTPDEIYHTSGTPIVTYSDVQGGFTGTNNIDTDPCFVDADGGDLNLRSQSLCIDAGDSTALLAVPVIFDLDGKNRYVDIDYMTDTGSGSFEFLDMGAYEFHCSGIAGDNNCDGRVNFEDLSRLCDNWLAGTEP